MDYALIPTSPEVWAVIHARHRGELKVFSSYSDPDGRESGGGETARMETSYGFDGRDVPLLHAKTTWKIGMPGDYKRYDEKHEYWLCVGKEDA